MDTLKLQAEVDDVSDVLDLAALAFEEHLHGTGKADEARLRTVIESLREQVRHLR